MNMATEVPTVWSQLAEAMYLQDSATAEVKLSERASFSFGRFQSSKGLPEIARPVVGERGHIVALQLKAIPFIEQFFGKRKVSSGSYPIGGVSAIDLQEEPAVLLPNPFDALVIYVTQSALDEVAYAHHASRVEQLAWPQGAFDPVVYHLGRPSCLRWSSPITLRRSSWTMCCRP
jgi:AraC family transcriptional regulator